MRHHVVLDKSFPITVIHHTPLRYSEPLHWHTCFEIGLCMKGKGEFYFGNKTYDVHEGDVYITNNLERHIARSDEITPSEYIFIYFDATLIDNREMLLPFFSRPRDLENRIPFTSTAARNIKKMILLIAQEISNKNIVYKDIVKSYLNTLCIYIFRHYYAGLDYNPKMDCRQAIKLKEKIQPALQFIKENFSNSISIEDVSKVIYLSPSRTYHLFTEAVGEGFISYLSAIRVNEAKRLLAETDLTITEVYANSGFQSHSSFYRTFTKLVGLVPSEYRTIARTIDSEHAYDPDQEDNL